MFVRHRQTPESPDKENQDKEIETRKKDLWGKIEKGWEDWNEGKKQTSQALY